LATSHFERNLAADFVDSKRVKPFQPERECLTLK
jgi:hypothetical protein